MAVITVGLFLTVGSALGATYVSNTWDSTENWAAKADPAGPAHGTLIQDGSGSLGAGVLEVNAAAGEGSTDYIFTDSTGTKGELIDGTGGGNSLNAYNFGAEKGEPDAVDAVAFIQFDFYSDSNDGGDELPGNLYFYFYTSQGGGTLWRLNIADEISAGWSNDITIGLWDHTTAGSGWNQVFGGADWNTALGDVDEMGVMLAYTGNNGQVYGIDNYEMHNPEPGTYAVLAFALVSLGVTFRGKLRTGVKGLLRK
jgi:hypothetical protein